MSAHSPGPSGSPGPAGSPGPSAYALALGDGLDRLRPQIRDYFVGPPEAGLVCYGEGVFEVVRTVPTWLRWLMRPVAGPKLFLARNGENVPFTVLNRPGCDSDGHPALEATRTLRYFDTESVFVDVVTTPGPGLVLDRLGASRRIEALLTIEATTEGTVRMRSRSTAIRLGPVRIPLPRAFGVQIDGTDDYDEASGRHLVNVVGTNPLLGTMIEYRGSFVYEYRAEGLSE